VSAQRTQQKRSQKQNKNPLQSELVLRHRGFDEYMTLAVYRGENAGGTDEESLRG
jgi:hypothetical protein